MASDYGQTDGVTVPVPGQGAARIVGGLLAVWGLYMIGRAISNARAGPRIGMWTVFSALAVAVYPSSLDDTRTGTWTLLALVGSVLMVTNWVLERRWYPSTALPSISGWLPLCLFGLSMVLLVMSFFNDPGFVTLLMLAAYAAALGACVSVGLEVLFGPNGLTLGHKISTWLALLPALVALGLWTLHVLRRG